MEYVLLFSLVWVFVCYHMAKRRNRNVLLGALGGLLFGIFSVFYYAVVGEKK